MRSGSGDDMSLNSITVKPCSIFAINLRTSTAPLGCSNVNTAIALSVLISNTTNHLPFSNHTSLAAGPDNCFRTARYSGVCLTRLMAAFVTRGQSTSLTESAPRADKLSAQGCRCGFVLSMLALSACARAIIRLIGTRAFDNRSQQVYICLIARC